MAKRTKRPSPEARPVFDPAAIDAIIGDTKTPAELEALFRAMKQVIVERMLNAELTHHLGYERGEAKPVGQPNHRNGSTPKTVLTDDDTLHLAIPRDRTGTFEPQVVPKNARRLPGFDAKGISLAATTSRLIGAARWARTRCPVEVCTAACRHSGLTAGGLWRTTAAGIRRVRG